MDKVNKIINQMFNLKIESSQPINCATNLALSKSKFDLSHLNQDTQYVYGPIQDDEALFLYSIIKVLRPKSVVECGMYQGYSTQNILSALDSNAKLYTFDIQLINRKAIAFNDIRFKFIKKSQADFDTNDVDNKLIDLVYLDDGHIFDVNVKFWEKILPSLTYNAVVIMHDTGLHINDEEKYAKNCVCEFNNSYCGWAHCIDDRHFINWVIDKYPEWSVINFHSFNIYRHGLTILQRKFKLEVKNADRNKCKLMQ